jgi:hypothetical protein
MVVMLLPAALGAQVIVLADSQYASVPYGENFQNIEVERSPYSDSLHFYTVYDLNSAGLVNVYSSLQPRAPQTMRLVRSYLLPYLYRHPGGFKVKGDTLIVMGVNNGSVVAIGYFNKYTGALLSEAIDTLERSWFPTTCYVHQDTLYRIISNSREVEVQQQRAVGWTTVIRLFPPPQRDRNNYIQGSAVLLGRVLSVLTSFPTRTDFYDLGNNFAYLGRNFGADGGLESQGLTSFESADTVYLYYGMRFPNTLRVSYFPKRIQPPALLFPEAGSIVATHSLSFSWRPVAGAFGYQIFVAFDSTFSHLVRYDTLLVNSQYINELAQSGMYYWRVKAVNVFAQSGWSEVRKVKLDVLADTQETTLVPNRFEVYQNYPNPFNGRTMIKYYLPSIDHIRVDLYDVQGRHMRNLFDGIQLVGYHSVAIDLTNEASGSYFCLVHGLGAQRVVMMTLMK